MSEQPTNKAGNEAGSITEVLPDEPRGGVYVIGFGPYVKIGISINVGKRVANLQTPEPVRIYAVLDGGRRQETELHWRFEKYRLNGEWFRHEGELAKWISGGCRFPAKRRVRFPKIETPRVPVPL